MLPDIPTVDTRDVVYSALGLALLGLTVQPALARYRLLNIPLYYIVAGIGLGALGVPLLDPRAGGLPTKAVEHAAELIVIISLAGAGLAIDTPMTWRGWGAAFRLLIVAMPITIAATALAGLHALGLGLASALLLGASLAPTDPVMARTVQVAPPGQGEGAMEVSLTAEAGMNDGLAFPFVYLAITVAGAGWALAPEGALGLPDWFGKWVGFDLVYRVAVGVLGGLLVGLCVSKLVFSPLGDGSNGAWNAIVTVLAATLLAYGLVEAIDGYGFLAVFFAARAGRRNTRGTPQESYEKFVHHGADQLESILLALLLLWFGTFLWAGGLRGITWPEVLFAAALILIIRPLGGWLSLIGHDCPPLERAKVAFFGVRGMGSIFYIAYAQDHADFPDIEAVWRIAALVIVASIAVHGFAANFAIDPEAGEAEGHRNPHDQARGDGRG